MAEVKSVLLANATCWANADARSAQMDLLIDGDRIAELRPAGQADSLCEVVDCTGLTAIPGLIDCHDHLRNLTPGIPENRALPLEQLLPLMWDLQVHMGATEYRLAATLGAVQRLKSGVTTVVDHCYPYHLPGLDEPSIEGYIRSGIRWFYARGIMTRGREGLSEAWDKAADSIRRLVDSGLVPASRLLIAPVSIRQAYLEDYTRSRELADELGCMLHTHIAETVREISAWLAETGKPAIASLEDLGFLTSRTHLVHCIHLEEGDAERISAQGCHVIDTPYAHFDSGKGATDVRQLVSAGVNVAVGLDKMTDPFRELGTLLGLNAGVDEAGHPPLSCNEAFRLLTECGGRALGRANDLGVLAKGAIADVVLIRNSSLPQRPVIDPRLDLIYGAHPSMVRHVLVDGQFMVRDGKLANISEADLVQEADEVANFYLARIGHRLRTWSLSSERTGL